MAVPKKKTSKSKRNTRRSHHKLNAINVVVDTITGEYRLPHHMSKLDGTYNDMPVITRKPSNYITIDETEAKKL